MADVHGSPGDAPQMPQAAGPGPAPVPYAGPGLRPEPPGYAVDLGPMPDPASDVVHGVTGLGTVQDPSAHDISAGTADAPYYPGPAAPINAAGDDDAGGRDDVSPTVAGAVANATGRWREFQSDTYGLGSTYGDLMHFPPIGQDPGAGVGNTLPTEGFYDPPRDYGGAASVTSGELGGEQGLPGYEGKPI